MRGYGATLVGLTATLASAAAAAPADFIGLYAGPEIGLHEHHVYLEATRLSTGETTGRYYRQWGVGGGAFAGYGIAIAPRLRLGAEAAVSLGGDGPVARFDDDRYARDPRWGYRLTARAGYLLADRLMAYGTFGFGGHRYRTRTTIDVENSRDWGHSFVVGGGVQYKVNPRIDVRLDFKHLDNQMSSILVGVPIRF